MKTYGLLGRDISYSLSPYMHNAAFKALGIDAEYRIFDIPETRISSFFSRLKKQEISGCNVTIPYKEEALAFVAERSAATDAIGALNTVVWEGGMLKGHNTDYIGFMMALRGNREGDLNFNPEGKNVFLFGAGGAARAILYVLVDVLSAKKVIIADIDTEKAERLAGHISEQHKGDTTIAVAHDKAQFNDFIAHSDLLINATPCGMKKGDGDLFDYRYIEKRHYVFDLVYSVKTPLVIEAEKQAARTIDGLNMLLYQAARSFEHWAGEGKAPLDVMKAALVKGLKRG